MRAAPVVLLMSLLVLVGCSSAIAGQGSPVPGASVTSPTTSSGSSESSSGSSSASESSASTSSSTSQTSRTTTSGETSSSTTSTETTPTFDLPSGFDWWSEEDGLAYRGMDPDTEFQCQDNQQICFGIEVFSGPGCPTAATVEVTVYPNSTSDEVLGTANGTTGAIPAGGTAQAIVGFDTTEADASAAVSNVVCT